MCGLESVKAGMVHGLGDREFVKTFCARTGEKAAIFLQLPWNLLGGVESPCKGARLAWLGLWKQGSGCKNSLLIAEAIRLPY